MCVYVYVYIYIYIYTCGYRKQKNSNDLGQLVQETTEFLHVSMSLLGRTLIYGNGHGEARQAPLGMGGAVAGQWRDNGGTMAGHWVSGDPPGGTMAGQWRDNGGTWGSVGCRGAPPSMALRSFDMCRPLRRQNKRPTPMKPDFGRARNKYTHGGAHVHNITA